MHLRFGFKDDTTADVDLSYPHKLRSAQDPVIAKLDAAPYDDEELSADDLQAIRQARSEPGVPWSETEAEWS